MVYDAIMRSWLQSQREEAEALNAASDLATIVPVDDQHFLVDLRCRGLVRKETGEIAEAGRFAVGIAFCDDYLRVFDPAETIYLIEPCNTFHPNVYRSAICAGRMSPGTGLVDLVQQIWSILTYQHMNVGDPLNKAAADWARDQAHRFPIDKRTLRRRRLNLGVEEAVGQ